VRKRKRHKGGKAEILPTSEADKTLEKYKDWSDASLNAFMLSPKALPEIIEATVALVDPESGAPEPTCKTYHVACAWLERAQLVNDVRVCNSKGYHADSRQAKRYGIWCTGIQMILRKRAFFSTTDAQLWGHPTFNRGTLPNIQIPLRWTQTGTLARNLTQVFKELAEIRNTIKLTPNASSCDIVGMVKAQAENNTSNVPSSSNEDLLSKILPPPEGTLQNEAQRRDYILCTSHAIANFGEITRVVEATSTSCVKEKPTGPSAAELSNVQCHPTLREIQETKAHDAQATTDKEHLPSQQFREACKAHELDGKHSLRPREKDEYKGPQQGEERNQPKKNKKMCSGDSRNVSNRSPSSSRRAREDQRSRSRPRDRGYATHGSSYGAHYSRGGRHGRSRSPRRRQDSPCTHRRSRSRGREPPRRRQNSPRTRTRTSRC
jgi:hypothetical protein